LTQCAIATPHVLATEAGVAAYRHGGNAVDAALAAAATLTVVYPHMCAVGGDVLALLAEPGGDVVALNGSGAAPAATDPEQLGGEMPLSGPATVTVPGAVRAWQTIAAAGRLPLRAALEAAIAHARDGVAVAPSLARALDQHGAELATDAGARALFFADGRPLGEGMSLVQPALARSLAAIADIGAEAFYGPEVGGPLVEGLRALGSRITLDDLRAHETERTAPLRGAFGGDEVLTTPPNSQGFVLLQTLNAIERLGDVPDPLGPQAAVLAELFRLGALDRDLHLADPRFADVPLDRLLSGDYAEDLLARAREGASAARPEPTGRASGDTVAVVTADADGNAVSLIQSVFHAFGAQIVEPRTGILCHNRGASFSLDPDSPNRLAPGKRPAHTLMPVLVRRDGAVVGVHGTMGGRAQAQIHTHLMLRVARGEDAAAALSAPRFVVGGLDAGDPTDTVLVEARVDDGTVERFRTAGMPVVTLDDVDENVGHAQMIRRGPGGELTAATDPRADGSARVIDPG
jgi:gamma-glutamyltranspeptidase/glutathione hydrolase